MYSLPSMTFFRKEVFQRFCRSWAFLYQRIKIPTICHSFFIHQIILSFIDNLYWFLFFVKMITCIARVTRKLYFILSNMMGEGRGNFWLYVLFYSIMPTIEDLKQEISKNTKNRESIAGSWGKIQVLTLSYIWLHFKKLDEYHIQWKQKLPSMCQQYFRDTQAKIYAKVTSQRFYLLITNGI